MIDKRLELGGRAEVLDSFNVFEIFIELGHLLRSHVVHGLS